MAHVHMLSDIETGSRPHWKAAVYAGLIAALVFLLVEMFLVTAAGNSPWAPVRMIGAIALGQDVLPPPASFAFGIFIAAAVVHFVLAIIYSTILSLAIFRLDTWLAIIGGGVFGLLLYWVNFYGFTELFPWFVNARGSINIVAHLIFGIVAALSYKELAQSEISKERRIIR